MTLPLTDTDTDAGAGLRALLAPRSIAVVGATDSGPTPRIVSNLETFGFEGPLYLVNPNRTELGGRPVHASVAACPGPVDLAVVVTGAGRLLDAARDCVGAGARALLVYTAGLGELGGEGEWVERALIELTRSAGVPLLGPNTTGFVNVVDRVAAVAFPPVSLPAGLRPGTIGIVSQSSGLMISAMELGSALGAGFTRLCATGNEAGLSSLDLLEHLIEDEATRTIGYVLEGVADGARLLALAARALELGKPIVALRIGRSDAGRRAALTHTGSVSGPTREFEAACRQAGIVLARTPAELLDRLLIFGKPQRVGGRLAVMTMSGGIRGLAADMVEEHGLELAELSDHTRERLRAALPDFAVVDNPLDITPVGAEDPRAVRACVEALDADPAVGTLVLCLHLKRGGGSDVQRRLIEEFSAAGETSDSAFVLISTIPDGIGAHWREHAAAGAVPFLNDLAGFGALRAAADYDRRRGRAAPAPVASGGATAHPRLGSHDRPSTEAEAYPLLEAYGLPVAPWRLARSADEVEPAARDLGYPLVLKACSPQLPHKTDVGAVRVGISDAGALARQWQAVAEDVAVRAPDARLDGVLVQRMVDPGVELLVGTTLSTDFGPMITVGLGGVWTEALADTAMRLCPVDVDGALEMLRELRGAAVLDGARGGRSVDVRRVAQVVSLVSSIAVTRAGEIESIELNPVIAGNDAVWVVDALIVPRGEPS